MNKEERVWQVALETKPLRGSCFREATKVFWKVQRTRSSKEVSKHKYCPTNGPPGLNIYWEQSCR